ncbi:8-amino-7-oxononanoate synthase [Aquisphaera giovannonii]|uniref:8-amino-7-oxononanoate synthase n=1 Tax=Aquisphaera giovannonii TaxID=406548 RepID=A0A5B9W672_9BACT|nr:pyridoxal phosphate-dependent aminotransferase family protein [Aquisphaera giovannonii]QEH36176.1 8-amino-7-oxononanoate synthase [Aquisphaera giovannonii]
MAAPSPSPRAIDKLTAALKGNTLVRILEDFEARFPDAHMKDLVVDDVRGEREVLIEGKWVTNFGSDSFLGLDRDPRVLAAIRSGLHRWGSHNGTSRAFSSVRSNADAEDRLADWLGIEATLIYPSVTLANHGAIPGLVGRKDVIVLDELAHNSMQEGAKLAQAGGTRVATFPHSNPEGLEAALSKLRPYRLALVCVDGVYSMGGDLAPLAALREVASARDGVLYVDDAHGSGVLGPHGRGTVRDALGNYDDAIVVGSLSKAFSCAGGFVGCTAALKKLLKIRSNTYIFGGPVVPAYLEAIGQVLSILESAEYDRLRSRLDGHIDRLTRGLEALELVVSGGAAPIVSILVGDEADTLKAGRFLFDRGYYVQSVLFPAVPYHGGVLRVQCNANHSDDAIDGLVSAFDALAHSRIKLPRKGDRRGWGTAVLDKVAAYCAEKLVG